MNLKNLRDEIGISQEEFAKKMGLKQKTYCNYENGTTEPKIELLCKMADFYGVSMDYLVGRTYNDNIGYIEKADKETIKLFLTLNELNKVKVASFIAGLLAVQN